MTFDGNMEAIIGHLADLFVEECSAMFEANQVSCYSVESGSIIVTFRGTLENINAVIDGIISDGYLDLPSFIPISPASTFVDLWKTSDGGSGGVSTSTILLASGCTIVGLCVILFIVLNYCNGGSKEDSESRKRKETDFYKTGSAHTPDGKVSTDSEDNPIQGKVGDGLMELAKRTPGDPGMKSWTSEGVQKREPGMRRKVSPQDSRFLEASPGYDPMDAVSPSSREMESTSLIEYDFAGLYDSEGEEGESETTGGSQVPWYRHRGER